MKVLEKILVLIGLGILLLAALGKIFGRPQSAVGIKIISLIIVANTVFLLAILAKLCEKK